VDLNDDVKRTTVTLTDTLVSMSGWGRWFADIAGSIIHLSICSAAGC
jgi:hypothetical protein